jgi:hypothetical protein
MEYICTSNFLLNGIRVECGFRNAWHIIHACEILSDEGRPVLVSWQAPHKAAEVDWAKYSVGIPESVPEVA